MLILLRHEDWRLRDTLRTLGARISLQYDVLLSVRVIPPHQGAELSRYQFPFYRAIQEEGITLLNVDNRAAAVSYALEGVRSRE